MARHGGQPRRSYEEGCLAAHALDLIGDRWALLVVRELMLGPRRFGSLRAGLPGISANILTQRLEELAGLGLLRRDVLPPPANVQVYALTEAGFALWPVIRALCQWGAGRPGHDPRQFISPVSLMLSMQAMLRPGTTPALTVGFDFGEDHFTGRMGQGYSVQPGRAPSPDLVFAGTTNALARVIYGPLAVAEACAEAGVGFLGDPRLGQRFVDRFSLR